MSDGRGRFTGKIAIVTGGATGIGRAIAIRLATEGATVIVADVNAGFGAATERDLNELSPQSRFVPCDVSKSSDVQAMVDAVLSEHGRIDVLVNNAGIPGNLAPIDQLDEDVWDRVLAVNLRGVFLCTKYALRGLTASPSGAIVNIASTFGMIGAPNTPAYAASKGASSRSPSSLRSILGRAASGSTPSRPATSTTTWTSGAPA